MKKILLILPMILVLAGCTNKEPIYAVNDFEYCLEINGATVFSSDVACYNDNGEEHTMYYEEYVDLLIAEINTLKDELEGE